MGGFINSQADIEICEVLNKRFSDDSNLNDPQGEPTLPTSGTISGEGTPF